MNLWIGRDGLEQRGAIEERNLTAELTAQSVLIEGGVRCNEVSLRVKPHGFAVVLQLEVSLADEGELVVTDNLVFEVSVLTPPEAITVENPKEYLAKIKVGEDGLIVEKGPYKGLLLPQVPVEWEWCEEEFLCQCCVKAGLPPDIWLTKGAYSRFGKF